MPQQPFVIAIAFFLFALVIAAAINWGGRKGNQPAMDAENERIRRLNEWHRAQRECAERAKRTRKKA